MLAGVIIQSFQFFDNTPRKDVFVWTGGKNGPIVFSVYAPVFSPWLGSG